MNEIKEIQTYRKTKCKSFFTRLSIVIPTFNKEVKLFRLINSILCSSTEKYDLKIVVVDNYEGDTNNIIVSIDEINRNSKYKIIYYQNERNIGMVPNWNRCFDLANSDYAIMIHTDDWLIENSLKHVFHTISKGLEFCLFGRITYYANTGIYSTNIEDIYLNESRFYRLRPIDVYVGTTPVAPTGFLMKISKFKETGGFLSDIAHWPADFDFVILLAHKYNIYYYNFPIVVKEEGDGNDGTNLSSTIPWVKNMKLSMLKYITKPNMLNWFIIYNRVSLASKSFGIDYSSYMSHEYPRWINTKVSSFIFRVIKKIVRITMKSK